MKKRRPTASSSSPRSDRPKELLETISACLQNKIDITWFRSVCKSWQISVPHFHFHVCLPYLRPFHQPHSFLSLKQTAFYYLKKPPPPPPSSSSSSASSSSSSSSSSTSTSCGWLIKLRESLDHDHHDQHYHRINPLSPIQIHPLPHTFPSTVNTSNFRVLELAKSYSLQSSSLTFCDYKVAFLPNPNRPSLLIIACGVLWSLNLFGQDDKWRVIDDMLSQLSDDDVDDCGRIVLVDPTYLQVIRDCASDEN